MTTASDELLTTGEAARLIDSSREHVRQLCERGLLAYTSTGTHRRVRRRDVEALKSRTEGLTRDQRRSLWLGYAQAGKLVQNPEPVIAKALENLERLRSIHRRGQAARWLASWDTVLHGPIDAVLEVLTSWAPQARELRQNSPFAGVLSQTERHEVLAAFRASDGASDGALLR